MVLCYLLIVFGMGFLLMKKRFLYFSNGISL